MNRLVTIALLFYCLLQVVHAQDSVAVYSLIKKGISTPDKFSKHTQNIFTEAFALADSLDNPQWEYDILVQFGTTYKEINSDWALDKLVQAQAISNAVETIPISKNYFFT